MSSEPFRDGHGVAKFRHEVIAAILRVSPVGGARLEVLVWRRTREPFTGRLALPSGPVDAGETMDEALERHLATKLDLTDLGHCEQLVTLSDPGRDPFERTIATAYVGLVGPSVEPGGDSACRGEPLAGLGEMAFDHRRIVTAALERVRAKLSYTNIAYALAPAEFTLARLRDLYIEVLGHDVDATNLGRVLGRRGEIVATGRLATPGVGGGRPARTYRFGSSGYRVTDPFAVLRPVNPVGPTE